MGNARTYLENIYLDMVNNYLSVDLFAEHNGITTEQAQALLAVAKSVFESAHPDA
jgi:hypothetical protein